MGRLLRFLVVFGICALTFCLVHEHRARVELTRVLTQRSVELTEQRRRVELRSKNLERVHGQQSQSAVLDPSSTSGQNVHGHFDAMPVAPIADARQSRRIEAGVAAYSVGMPDICAASTLSRE